MKVFSSVRLGVSPKINALATIVVLFVSVCAVVAGILMFRAERRRKLEIQAAMRDTA
jgi:putrescine transport system permease protein